MHIGKLFISPVISFSSYVLFYSEELYEKNKLKKIVFFMSGIIANFVLALIACICIKKASFYMMVLIEINVFMIVGNAFPIFGTDMKKMIEYLRKIIKNLSIAGVQREKQPKIHFLHCNAYVR
jgi:hypothetical protein